MKYPASRASQLVLPWLVGCCAFAQQPGTIDDSVQLAMPFQSWGVRIDNPGAVVEYREMKSGRQAYILASHAKNGIVISITIEIVSQPPPPGECRTSLEDKKDSYGRPSGLRFTRIIGTASGLESAPSADVMEFLLDQD